MPSFITQEPRTLLKALVAHARRRGVRQVEATPDGVVIVDGVGRRHPVTIDGEEVTEAHRDIPGYLRLGDETAPMWGVREHQDHGELGEWDYRFKGETLVLRPRRATPPCVDALFKSAPEGMDQVRALYGRPGVAILVRCQGKGRARDLAQALVAELAAFGADVTLEHRHAVGGWYHGSRPVDDHVGMEPFDQHAREGVASAEVVFEERVPANLRTPPEDVTRVTVVPLDATPSRWGPDLGDEPGVLAVVDVRLDSDVSAPRMIVALSPKAAALAADPLPVPGDATWVTYRTARDGRPARPAKPKTWHQTTEQVARAFVAREAPRGLVSGYALYFHGPVAYSVGDYNPIAAYVTDRDGGTVLVTGRKDVGGVSRKAVVSMAQGDLTQAFGRGFPTIDLDAPLSGVLRWGGRNLEDAAFLHGRAKDEASRPRSCEVDVEAMGSQFQRRLADLEKERVATHRPNFPTLGHAHATAQVAKLVGLRDEVVERLGVELPPLGDAAALRAQTDAAYQANADHVSERARVKAEKAARRAAAEVGDAPEAPAP